MKKLFLRNNRILQNKKENVENLIWHFGLVCDPKWHHLMYKPRKRKDRSSDYQLFGFESIIKIREMFAFLLYQIQEHYLQLKIILKSYGHRNHKVKWILNNVMASNIKGKLRDSCSSTLFSIILESKTFSQRFLVRTLCFFL